MMNIKFKMALASSALLVSCSMFAGPGDVLNLTPGKSYATFQGFGIPVVDGVKASVKYDLVSLDQNKDLTKALRAELMQAKAQYPGAITMTREYYNNGMSWKLVGTGYSDKEGKVINYSLTYF